MSSNSGHFGDIFIETVYNVPITEKKNVNLPIRAIIAMQKYSIIHSCLKLLTLLNESIVYFSFHTTLSVNLILNSQFCNRQPDTI